MALLAMVAGVYAQGRRGFGMMMGGGAGVVANPTFLLQRTDVKDDLKLTDDQKIKLSDIQSSVRNRMQSMFTGGARPDFSDPKAREEFQAKMQKVMDDIAKEIDAVLTEDQRKRLKEISFQFAGNSAALDKNAAKDLGITDDQKTRIEELNKKAQAANRSLQEQMRSQDIDFQEYQARSKKNSEVLNEEIGKILTDDQKAKLKTMQGKPFERKDDQQGG